MAHEVTDLQSQQVAAMLFGLSLEAPTKRPAGQGAAAAAPAWGHLPEAALSCIFSKLKWMALPRVATVCRRWRAVALHSPQCLTSLGARVGGRRVDYTLRVLRWFQLYAAPRVHSLILGVMPPPGRDQGGAAALYAAAEQVLEACGAAGRLTRLELHFERSRTGHGWEGCQLGPWLASLSGLTWLDVAAAGPLTVHAPLGGLTALHWCRLRGARLLLPAELQLPASLTQLCLDGCSTLELPAGLSALSNLAALELHNTAALPSSYSTLQTLTSLRSLALSNCGLSAHLSSLTNLTSLGLVGMSSPPPDLGTPLEALQVLLRPLRGLRRLALQHIHDVATLPPVVLELHLTSLTWTSLG